MRLRKPGSIVPPLLSLMLITLVSLIAAGCGRDEAIRVYKIPRETRAAAVPNRLLGAMVPRGARTWFFKLVGPESKVTPHAKDFRALIESLQFSDAEGGQPAWTLPAGWTQQPGQGMRFATLQAPGERPAPELSVIPLPTSGDSLPEYLLANVNRWRRELSLPDIALEDLDGATDTLQVGEIEITLVDLTGTPSASNSMSAPFAGGNRPPPATVPPATVPPSAPAAAPQPAQLAFDKPASWEQAPADQFSLYAFGVSDGERQARITVTPFSGGGGSLADNINRWRRQIGLAELAEDTIESQTPRMPAGPYEAYFVELASPDGASRQQTMLGAIVTDDRQTTWFIKMLGDAALVQGERQAFLDFLKSLNFSGQSGTDEDGN